MKPLTIALIGLVFVTGVWWMAYRIPVFLILSDQTYEAGYKLDFWGPEILNGTYRITKSVRDPEGFRLYGYRLHKLAWIDNCIVRPSVNEDGWTVTYYEDGLRHYLWSPYDPREG